MTFNEIFRILSTKPNNQHYLRRYIKFIEACVEDESTGYREQHHICPKAADLFPEYSSFKTYPWNSVFLTARQHILAHIMLWKAFGGSQTTAAHYMVNVQNYKTGYNNRLLPTSVEIRYAAELKVANTKAREAFASYKDLNGNIQYLHRDDPKIKELGLVGAVSGRVHSEETRNQMSNSKLKNRKVTMTFLDLKRNVGLWSEEYTAMLVEGWKPLIDVGSTLSHMDPEDVEYCLALGNQKKSEKFKGTSQYQYPDGTPYGTRLVKGDPIIEELGLVFFNTEAKTKAVLENQKLAVEANLGSVWYNNGEINKKFKVNPGEPWVIGQMENKAAVDARRKGLLAAVAGSKTYNDGIRNYRVKEGDFIDPSWKPGMAPQKSRKPSNVNGTKIYNDGIRSYRVPPGGYIDPSWSAGMAPRK